MSKELTKNDLVDILIGHLNLSDKEAHDVLNHLVKKIFDDLSAYKEVTLTGFKAPITIKQKSKDQAVAGQPEKIPSDQRLTFLQQSSKPSIEQRKLRRRNFILDVEVFDNQSQQALGDLGDITTEGIMLVSDKPFKESHLFAMRIELPKEAEEELEINFEATSVRCQKTIHEDIYFTGFKINSLDAENKQKIEHFINEFAV